MRRLQMDSPESDEDWLDFGHDLHAPGVLRLAFLSPTAPSLGRQINPSRTAAATACERLRALNFVTMSWITFFTVRSL
jgi:hypothetical protein